MKWKIFTKIVLKTFAFLMVSTLVGFVHYKKADQSCGEIYVDLDSELFISSSEVVELFTNMGVSTDNTMHSVSTHRLEDALENHEMIRSAEVYQDIKGNIYAKVQTRTPEFRVYNFYNQSYFIDSEGLMMPVSDKYVPRVPIVSGDIFTQLSNKQRFDTSWVRPSDSTINKDVQKVLSFIRKSTFWKAQITELHVSNEGVIEMYPRVGMHKIILGDAGNLEEKMRKLYLLYKRGFSKVGWNQFELVDLRFSGQIVCKKNQNG